MSAILVPRSVSSLSVPFNKLAKSRSKDLSAVSFALMTYMIWYQNAPIQYRYSFTFGAREDAWDRRGCPSKFGLGETF